MSVNKYLKSLNQKLTAQMSIKKQRSIAAKASGGISSNAVYVAFENVVQQLNSKGDVLDFGAGKGNLARRFQTLGHFRSITAIDFIQKPPVVNSFIRWISQDLNYPTELPSQAFDVIVSAEVVEHLENPRAVVREWFRLLRPGGTLVFSTPNNESWRSLIALLVMGHFIAFNERNYPAHITALLRKDIERILKETGVSLPKFIFSNAGSIPKLPKLRWQTISGGLLKGLRYSDNLLVVTEKTSYSEK